MFRQNNGIGMEICSLVNMCLTALTLGFCEVYVHRQQREKLDICGEILHKVGDKQLKFTQYAAE